MCYDIELNLHLHFYAVKMHFPIYRHVILLFTAPLPHTTDQTRECGGWSAQLLDQDLSFLPAAHGNQRLMIKQTGRKQIPIRIT